PCQPISKLQAAAAGKLRSRVIPRKDGRKAGRRVFTRVVIVAANQNFLFYRISLFYGTGELRLGWRILFQFLLLLMKLFYLGPLLVSELRLIFIRNRKGTFAKIDFKKEPILAFFKAGPVRLGLILASRLLMFCKPLGKYRLPYRETLHKAPLVFARNDGAPLDRRGSPFIQIAAHSLRIRLQKVYPFLQ